jgi:hypothetical protein
MNVIVTIEARFADATALATELAMPPLLAHSVPA